MESQDTTKLLNAAANRISFLKPGWYLDTGYETYTRERFAGETVTNLRRAAESPERLSVMQLTAIKAFATKITNATLRKHETN